MTKVEILKKTEEFACRQMAGVKAPAHDFSHVLRVRKWAEKLAQMEKVGSFKIQLVALLHDIGRGKEDFKNGVAHAEASALLARPYLEKIKEISPADRREIIEAIKRHSKGRKDDLKLTQVFQDADRLDSLGVIGIIRLILYKPELKICHSRASFLLRKWGRAVIDAKRSKGEEVFSDIVSGFIFNLGFYDVMNTPSGKLLAKPLVKETKDFLKKLKKEL